MTTPPTALTKATERSISPISSTKTTPIAIVAIGGHLQEQVREVALGEEGVVEDAERDDDDDEADDDRERAELAGLHALPPQAHVARERLRLMALVDRRSSRNARDGRGSGV